MGKPLDATVMSALTSSGIGALGSLGSTFLNGVLNRDSMDRQVQASKDLMKYEWDNFKSPRAQVAALSAAGINPAVAFGNNSGAVATPVPSMPQSVPPSFNFNSISDFISAMANAKKAGLESVGQQLENEFNRKTLEERVRSVALQNNFTEENTMKVVREWQKLVSEASIMQTDLDIKRIDLEKHRDLLDWQLREYKDKHNLNEQQYHALQQQLPVILDKLKNEKDLLDVEVEMAKGYKNTMNQLGIAGQIIQIIGNIVKFFK